MTTIADDDRQKIRIILEGMAIVHETAMGGKISFGPPSSDSLEGRIGGILKQAFWDILRDDLEKDPPNFDQTFSLIATIKEKLLVVIPNSEDDRRRVEEELDSTHIKDCILHGVFDLHLKSDFVISVMQRCCSPAQDSVVAAIRELGDSVLVLRRIVEVLDLMISDQVNFTLAQSRALMVSNSVEYEQAKFKEYVSMVPDGLRETEGWLRHTISQKPTAESALREMVTTNLSPAGGEELHVKIQLQQQQQHFGELVKLIVNMAWVDLLTLELTITSETLMFDVERILCFKLEYIRLTLAAGILLVFKEITPLPVLSSSNLFKLVKEDVFALLLSGDSLDVQLKSICDSVLTRVSTQCTTHHLPDISPADRELFRAQVLSLSKDTSRVTSLIGEQVLRAVQARMAGEQGAVGSGSVPGVVKEEVEMFVRRYAELADYNWRVFWPFYNDIIRKVVAEMHKKCSSSPT